MEQGGSLRIAYLTPEFVTEPKFDGGLANYLHRVTTYLRSMGHDPEVFVLSDRNEVIAHQGMLVHRVLPVVKVREQFLRRAFRRVTRIDTRSALSIRCGALGLANALIERHREARFDLVQGSDYGATGLAIPRRRDFAFVTRLSYFRPLVRRAQGVRPTFDRHLAEILERRSILRSDCCFGPSRRIAQVVQETIGIPVEVIRPPISLNDSLTEDDSILRSEIGGREYVLFFGRVCQVKGADLLATAMAAVLDQHPSLHFVVVGRPDPPRIIDQMRRTLGPVGERFIHIGRLPHAQLFPIIRHAQAVALPSRIDNFPNVCIEAMRLGQIVVGTREASFDELIDDGINGFLASSDSTSSIAHAIGRALALTPTERQAMGAAAREKLREFDPSVTIPLLCDFYRQAITRRNGSRPVMAAS